LLYSENSLAFAPVSVYDFTEAVVAPLLVIVSATGAEVMPGNVEGKIRLVGEKEIGLVSIPVTAIAC
jgi:hypothetical protein